MFTRRNPAQRLSRLSMAQRLSREASLDSPGFLPYEKFIENIFKGIKKTFKSRVGGFVELKLSIDGGYLTIYSDVGTEVLTAKIQNTDGSIGVTTAHYSYTSSHSHGNIGDLDTLYSWIGQAILQGKIEDDWAEWV